MAQRSETGSGKPGYGHAPRARITELDPLRELPYGPAAHNGRIRGRTHVSTRPRSLLIPKILLASLGASTHVHKDSSQQHASFREAAFTGLHRLSITQNFCSDHGAQRDIGDLLLLVSLILWLMRDRPADVGLAAYGKTATADPVQPATTTPDRSGRHCVRRAADRRASGRRRRRRVRQRSHAEDTCAPTFLMSGMLRFVAGLLSLFISCSALRSPFDGPPVGGEGMMPACRQRLAHRSRTAVSRRRQPAHSRRSDSTQYRARMPHPHPAWRCAARRDCPVACLSGRRHGRRVRRDLQPAQGGRPNHHGRAGRRGTEARMPVGAAGRADALRRVQMWTFERFSANHPVLCVSPCG